jgi:hypothetical protein
MRNKVVKLGVIGEMKFYQLNAAVECPREEFELVSIKLK